MTKGDIQLIREFVAATEPWYAQLEQETLDSNLCANCNIKPHRMMQLGRTLTAFLAAYDLKYGKR